MIFRAVPSNGKHFWTEMIALYNIEIKEISFSRGPISIDEKKGIFVTNHEKWNM